MARIIHIVPVGESPAQVALPPTFRGITQTESFQLEVRYHRPCFTGGRAGSGACSRSAFLFPYVFFKSMRRGGGGGRAGSRSPEVYPHGTPTSFPCSLGKPANVVIDSWSKMLQLSVAGSRTRSAVAIPSVVSICAQTTCYTIIYNVRVGFILGPSCFILLPSGYTTIHI